MIHLYLETFLINFPEVAGQPRGPGRFYVSRNTTSGLLFEEVGK